MALNLFRNEAIQLISKWFNKFTKSNKLVQVFHQEVCKHQNDFNNSNHIKELNYAQLEEDKQLKTVKIPSLRR